MYNFLSAFCFITLLGYRGANERNGRREDLDAREKHEIEVAKRKSLESYKEECEYQEVINRSAEEAMGQHQFHSAYGRNTFDHYSQDNQIRDRFHSRDESSGRETNVPHPPFNPHYQYGNFSASLPYTVNRDIPQWPGQQVMHQSLRESDEVFTMEDKPSAPCIDLYSVD